MTTRQGAPQRTHEHVVAQPHVAAYHAACGLTEPPDRAFLLYLAALTLPAFIAAARSAVPARSHGAGLHVAHEITTAAPITTGTALTTRVSAPTRFGSAGQLIGVESFTDA
ncbi:MAG TPA: hypothetical protein VK024_05845, partial [Actinomycetaceae bacterium]|nr:hypothetical protein [Actinomycetaceae bacterium]